MPSIGRGLGEVLLGYGPESWRARILKSPPVDRGPGLGCSGSLGAPAPLAVISGTHTGLSAPSYLAELPPPPAPRVRISYHRRQSRRALLRGGSALRLDASGRLAFRSGPITITAVARAGRRIIATVRGARLQRGETRLLLVPSPRASGRLRSRRAITVIVTVRGPAGIQTRRLPIKLTR